MTMFHIRRPSKRKKREPTREEKAAMENWKKMQTKWDSLPKFAFEPHRPKPQPRVAPELFPQVEVKTRPKLDVGSTAPPPVQQYTGTDMLGIGVAHKSGLQPVFSKEQAEDLAKMRR